MKSLSLLACLALVAVAMLSPAPVHACPPVVQQAVVPTYGMSCGVQQQAIVQHSFAQSYGYAQPQANFLLVPHQRQVFAQRQFVGGVGGFGGSSSNIVVGGRGRSIVSQQSGGFGGSSSNIVVNQGGGGLLGRLFGGGGSTVISQQSR